VQQDPAEERPLLEQQPEEDPAGALEDWSSLLSSLLLSSLLSSRRYPAPAR
jgi:hypothetical protein